MRSKGQLSPSLYAFILTPLFFLSGLKAAYTDQQINIFYNNKQDFNIYSLYRATGNTYASLSLIPNTPYPDKNRWAKAGDLTFSANRAGTRDGQAFSDWRHFYGVGWIGDPRKHIQYAKQMGYKYIYTGNYGDRRSAAAMGQYPEAADMKFYWNTPEASFRISHIVLSRAYTDAEKADIQRLTAWKSNDPFPHNLATGYSPDGTYFQIHPDFQQQAVIDYFVTKIIDAAKQAENPDRNWRFGGFMWDQPFLTGDFWSGPEPDGGRVVTLAYWTGKDSSLLHPGITHEYATYSEGRAAFYKKLFAEARKAFPEAHFMMEPNDLYRQWISRVESRPDRLEVSPPDLMLTQESNRNTTAFVDDERIFRSGLITRDRVGSTNNSRVEEYDNRIIAAKAAINGAWYNWYGRFGGPDTMPDFREIDQVYPRLKLVRMVPGWDNLAGIPLSSRSWDGTVYRSPNSYISPDLIYTRQPGTDKLFAVFLTTKEGIALRTGETVTSVQRTNGLFIESGDGSADVRMDNGKVFLKDASNTDKGYILTAQNSSAYGGQLSEAQLAQILEFMMLLLRNSAP